jgi:hypothetical protein
MLPRRLRPSPSNAPKKLRSRALSIGNQENSHLDRGLPSGRFSAYWRRAQIQGVRAATLLAWFSREVLEEGR